MSDVDEPSRQALVTAIQGAKDIDYGAAWKLADAIDARIRALVPQASLHPVEDDAGGAV